MLAFFMTILSLILYNDTKTEIKSQTQQSGEIEFNQYVEYLDGNFGILEKLTNYMVNNTSFHKLLNSKSDNILNKINKKSSVENYLTSMIKDNNIISSVNILSSCEYYGYGSYLFSQDLIDEFKDKSIQKSYSFSISAENPNIYSVMPAEKLIKSLDTYSYIEFSFFSNESTNWNVFIILNQKFLFRDFDDFTNIVLLKGEDILYKGPVFNNFKNDEIYTMRNSSSLSYKHEGKVHNLNLYLKKLLMNDLTVIYSVDAARYIQKLNVIRWWILFICIISLMLSFGASRLISGRITKPLQKLSEQLNTYQLDASVADTKVNKKKVKLKTKLLYYFTLMAIMPISIYLSLFYIQSENIIRGMTVDSSKSIFTKVSTQINRTIGNKISILQMLSFDETVQNFFASPGSYAFGDINNITEHLRYLGLNRDSVSFYNNDFAILFSDRQTRMQNNVIGSFDITKRGVVCSYNTDSIGDEFLSFSIPVVSVVSGKFFGEKLGYCRIDTELYRYRDILKPIEIFGGDAAIIDQNEKTLLYTKPSDWSIIQPLQTHDASVQVVINKDSIYYYNLVSGTDLYMVAHFEIKDIMRMSRPFIQTYFYLFLVFFLCILITSYVISANILKPIKKFNKKIRSYDLKGSNLQEESENESYFIDEIDSLNESFIKMSDNIETLVDDLIIANNENNMIAIERKNAEMAALQAQINPHFLYNTLNNFIALIRSGYCDEAISAIKLLGSLFKYGISREDVIIPIREELEYAKVYAELIKIRFGDRVSFFWDIQESVYGFTTIKLILQPLIENSIQHGFNSDCMKGTIIIICKEDIDKIIFEIKDNGMGISPEILAKIKETLESNNNGNHIGIFNVQERLKLHYGDSYNFEIISAVNEGTKVIMKIPKTSL